MNPKICPTCQSPIPADAPGGFCPACLLRGADETPAFGPAAPSVEEIAAAFPRLEVMELIGQGGMGFVYKVRQPDLDRIVALKILAPELGRDPAFAERFAREARTLGKLHHPNIITVFEHGEIGGFFYLIMEYVDGVNLRQAMRAGRFTPEQALAIVPGICDALQAAHAQGVWHRDIKPENILLDREGKVKIADFGIARIVGDPRRDFTLTLTGNALGSAAYMAPEQHEKPHDVDHRADIYSLGVVIYEMLTGELPLGRFPLPSQRAEVSARIDEIVLQTLEKERELRQQSANEVKTDVHRALRPGEPEPSPTGQQVTSKKPSLASVAFGLFIGGTLSLVLLVLIIPLSELTLLCGGPVLLAFALGLVCWREHVGKFVAIASGCLLLALGFLFVEGISDPVRGKRELPGTTITHEKAGEKSQNFPANQTPDPDTAELQRLQQLAKSSPDILRQTNTLLEALKYDWIRSVIYLLEQTRSEELYQLALSNAGRRGNIAMIQAILSLDADTKEKALVGALSTAVEANNLETVKFLISAGANVDGKVMHGIPEYQTPLITAASSGKLEIARLLISHGADVNLMPRRCLYWPSDSTFAVGAPLHEAIKASQQEMADLLLDHKADVNLAAPNTGITPLWLAVYRQNKINSALINRLLDMGADPDAESAPAPDPSVETWPGYPGKSTPLEQAILAGSVEAVKLMLATKKKNNAPVKSILLRDAVSRIQNPDACMEITRLLLDHGADPNPPDPIYEFALKAQRERLPVSLPENQSLLKLAVFRNFPPMARPPGEPDDFWPLPLVQLLLERGSKIDAEWKHKGFRYIQNEEVRKLLEAWSGANASQTTFQPPPVPQSPQMVARPVVPPPTPTVSVEEVFRKANAAANESNGEKFKSLIWENRTLIGDTVAGSGEDVRVYASSNIEPLEFMALFAGEITSLRVVSVGSGRVPKRNTFGPEGKFTPVAYATIRKGDGSLTRLGVSFRNKDGQWVGTEVWFPNYGAFSRIEFKPEKGDAATILKTHLGYATHFREVEGKSGQFDVFGYSEIADFAKANADRRVADLRKSLDRFNLSKYLKIVSPAEGPEHPYMGENEPPFDPQQP